MDQETVIRWTGLLGILAALLVVVSFFVRSQAILAVAAPLVMLTFIAIYLRQVEEMGILGLVGLLLQEFALVVYGAFAFFQGFMAPALSPEGVGAVFSSLEAMLLATGAVQAVGIIAFGVALLRADVLPRWGAVLLIIGTIPNGFPPMIPPAVYTASILLLAAGLAWLSYGLWAPVESVMRVEGAASAPP